MAAQSTIPRGTLLSGKYKVQRELGRGGMAAVYEALNVDIGKRVAIKLLAGHLATSQTVVERFLREARAVSQIRSPNVCDVYDSGRLDDGTPYLVMELLEGESLYDAMCRDRQMSPEVTLAIILQGCRGLAKAHEAGIVHRDLKPENIFLTVDDDAQLLVKILDFGLAKFYDSIDAGGGKQARLTREGAVFGTPAYMSPEQVRGQAAADTRADLWALACITYECFTGATVWSTEDGVAMTFAQIATAPLPDPRAYRPDLPLSFGQWFARALDRKIDNRFQDVQEFADGLAGAFNYSATGGGLDAGLVTRITSAALNASDADMITERLNMARPSGRQSSGPRSVASAPRSVSGSQPSSPYSTPGVAPSSRGGPGPLSAPNPPRTQVGPGVGLLPSVMPQPRSKTGLVLVVVALIAVVGFVISTLPDGPTEAKEAKRWGGLAKRLMEIDSEEASGFKFVAKHPWLPRVREAQALVAQGEHDRALATLRRVYQQHRHGMVRNLMDQVQVAAAARAEGARCQVTGYARPRRYDLLSQDRKPVDASAPTIVRGFNGALMTWTDARDGKRHAYAAPLDDELRNLRLAVDITPEGTQVSTPRLLPVAERYLATYWDRVGSAPGVYLRWLGADAVIAAAPVLVSEKRSGVYVADTARSDGGFVVGWSDRSNTDSLDLFARLFGEDGAARGEAIRLTDYTQKFRAAARVSEITVAEHEGNMHFAYIVVAGREQQLRYLVTPTDTKPPGLDTGSGKKPGQGHVIGVETIVSAPQARASQPALGCTPDGCFIAWQQTQKTGSGVAFIDHKTGKRQWHKMFTTQGKHPSIGVTPAGEAQIAWVDDSRLITASLGREGVGPVSKVARVTGDHQAPTITPGSKRGEWYVAWLDYESGHREPYAARIKCQ